MVLGILFIASVIDASDCDPSRISPACIEWHRARQDSLLEGGKQHALQQEYRLLWEKDFRSLAAHYLYARLLPADSALNHFQGCVAQDPSFFWGYLGAGASLEELGRLPEAETAYRRALKCKGRSAYALRNLARMMTSTGRYEEAKGFYRELLKTEGRKGDIFSAIGDLYLFQSARSIHKRNDLKKAVKAYLRAMELGFKDSTTAFRLGYAYFELGEMGPARRYYLAAEEAGKRGHDLYFNLGAACENGGYYEEALSAYERALAENPGLDQALLGAANACLALGLSSRAIEKYQDYLKIHPGHTEALFGLANGWQLKKNFAQAAGTYLSILEKDTLFVKAYYNLGSLYAYHVPDREKMRKYWEKYLSLAPEGDEKKSIRKELKRLSDRP